MDHYDLLAHPDWTAQSVLIVSPYVEQTFFERIVRDLCPPTLTVVIDDGCRPHEVAMMRDLAQNGTEVRAVLGSARGLVHAKIFHIEWCTTGGNRAHTLVYGSGNATRQAFAGNFNSELMCKVRLTAANHATILDWLTCVRAAASDLASDDRVIRPVRDAWLANGVHIRLPGLTIKDAANKASNLDLWLQRGRLLSVFRPDASFLRVHVNLLAELPAGDLMQRVRGIGFETPQTRRLSIPYIQAIEGGQEEGDGPGNWRARYFIWTQLGDWCSDACFRQERDRFKKAGHQERLQNLQRLEVLQGPGPKREARSRFLARVDQLWEAFGDRAATYLEANDGTLNREFYEDLFNHRLQRDLDLAGDEEFRERYINGCELIDVPRFRMDVIGWRSFVDSFMRQIHLEWLKARSPSLIYRYIYDGLEEFEDDVFDDYKKLGQILRANWNRHISDGEDNTTVGAYIDQYQADLVQVVWK